MRDYNVVVEVHCVEPRWVSKEGSRYRIYVDNELMVERTWIWDQNTYIQEHMVLKLHDHASHRMRLETIKTMPGAMTELTLLNITCDGHGRPGDGQEVIFDLP
jgi:hypothetical protein